MKILITTGIFKPEFGGPATLAMELGTRLKAAGHSVTIITYSDKPQFDFDKELSFRLIRVVRSNKLFNYIKYFFVVVREIKKHDILYSLDWFSVGMPIFFASLLTGRKYCVRVGGGYIWEKYLSQNKPPVTLKEFYEKGLYKGYRVMYEIIKRVLGRATKVVFNSTEQKILYEKYYNLNPKNTLTIFNATPESRFSTLLKTYKQETILRERDKEIVFVGRFIKMKNVESLIQAFAKLKDYSYKLVLIGSGPTEPLLRKLVTDLDIDHRVAFIPPLAHRELFRRIANCAYVVIPSWTDVSPHQAYECLAQGIPFLMTKENYLSINSHDFLKIDPHSVQDISQKMNWLLDPEHYADFTKKLASIHFEHSWNEVVSEHMKLFWSITKLSS